MSQQSEERMLKLLILGAYAISMVTCHGRLMDPPSRSSVWRQNIPGAVINYNDNSLFCGGFGVSNLSITILIYTYEILSISKDCKKVL